MCDINSYIPDLEQRDPIQFSHNTASVATAGITYGGVSDKKNQDDYFIIKIGNILFTCVFDGHASLEGKFVSHWARKICLEQIYIETFISSFKENPNDTLKQLFIIINEKVKQKMIERYTELEYEITYERESIIIKNKIQLSPYIVKGGTMMTLLVFDFDTNTQYTSYVGDCASFYIKTDESDEMLADECGGAAVEKPETILQYKILTEYSHDPSNLKEFLRIKDFKQDPENKLLPHLQFEYDTQKHILFKLWDMGELDYVQQPPPYGHYYKNVKQDIATYISSPVDNIKITTTRVIGDFSLKEYGVTCEPTIYSEPIKSGIYTVCSDGVGDNWLDLEFVKSIKDKSHENITEIVTQFMDINLEYAIQNFGSHRDDATAIFIKIE